MDKERIVVMDIIQLFHQADLKNTILYGAGLLVVVALLIFGAYVVIKGDVQDEKGEVISKTMGVLFIAAAVITFWGGLCGMRADVSKQVPGQQKSVSAEMKDLAVMLVSDPDTVWKLGKQAIKHLR